MKNYLTNRNDSLKLIDRRYRILESLGSGLSGEIYRVAGPEGEVALKLLRQDVPGLNREDSISTFKFEFSLLKGLSHPNLVRIFDFGFDEALQRFYFTQEWVEGAPLLKAVSPESLEKIQALFIQALQGLAYLHTHGVLHGDLKPDNLLVTKLDSSHPLLKIIDFGISHPGWVQYAGTPPYLAPEKILKEPADARSDLYSLAVVFYTLLTGSNPFARKMVGETLRAQLHFSPPSATTHLPALDPLWSELLDWMMKKNPRERLPSAEDGLKFLENRGDLELATAGAQLLPKNWIGSAEVLEKARAFLDRLGLEPYPHLLWVKGEPGLGKDHLITELKYEAQLRGIEVLSPDETPARKPAIMLLKEKETEQFLRENKWEAIAKKASLVLAVSPEKYSEISKKMAELPTETLKIRPLTPEETGAFLQSVTRHKNIPPPFLHALYRFSGGYPEPMTKALRHLLKDPRLVDASGKWHLAVFQEVEPTPEQLGLSDSSLAHALASKLAEEPQERWALNLRRSAALANEGNFAEALRLLNRLEKEMAGLFQSPQRLLQHARLLEKRGWVYTKQGRYPEAREAFAAGLSLLSESEQSQPALEIRLKNFLAFLDMQAGKVAEAVKLFKENARRAEGLSEQEQRLITNNELGSAYLAAGKTEEAIRRLTADRDFFSKFTDPTLLMKAGYNLAEAYSHSKKFAEAHSVYEQVAEIARKDRHWDYLLRAYNGLGNTATLQERRPEALDYYQRSLALAEYLRDYLSAATVAQNRGVILSELNRLEEALHELEISKRLLSKVPLSSHARYLMARATLELGEVYLKRRDFQKARNFFTEAMNRAEEDKNLRSFRFYPLSALARLALEEKNSETFRELYPKLIHLAQGEEEKNILAELMTRAPGDPRQGVERSALPAEETPSVKALERFPQEALYSILKINRALLMEHDSDQLFSKILQYASELSGAESTLLLEVGEDNALSIRAAYNTNVDQAQKEISHHVARRVLESGQPLATRDALGDRNFNQFQSVVSLHLRSIACVPIRLHQKIIGLLYLTHRNRPELFRPEVLRILEAFGDQAGLAMQNANQVQSVRELNLQLQEKLEDAEAFIDRLKTDLRSKIKNPYPQILGKSPALVEILHTLDRISDTNLTVLILGETGSGKELVARAIHENSRRAKGPFIAVNCGAIPENLLESELFGYVSGAFTGALRDKKGLIEEADGGTLFLDEVSELPLQMQVKLLRALQEKEIQRLGSTRLTPVDLRVVAASHRDIEKWMQAGHFREDLYYRLAQMILPVPPLRERLEDLPLLAEHFLKLSASELALKKSPRLGKDLLRWMMGYLWPGNVRELENMIRASSAFAERGVIHLGNLPPFLRKKLETSLEEAPSPSPAPDQPASLSETQTVPFLPFHADWTWKQYEEAIYAKALLRHQMNCEKVAEELGVGIATVYLKLRKYGLKTRAAKWNGLEPEIPAGIPMNRLKRDLIQTAFRESGQSPYLVAKRLAMNVGTVYRYLKEEKP